MIILISSLLLLLVRFSKETPLPLLLLLVLVFRLLLFVVFILFTIIWFSVLSLAISLRLHSSYLAILTEVFSYWLTAMSNCFFISWVYILSRSICDSYIICCSFAILVCEDADWILFCSASDLAIDYSLFRYWSSAFLLLSLASSNCMSSMWFVCSSLRTLSYNTFMTLLLLWYCWLYSTNSLLKFSILSDILPIVFYNCLFPLTLPLLPLPFYCTLIDIFSFMLSVML